MELGYQLCLLWHRCGTLGLPVAIGGMHPQVTVGDPHFHATLQLRNATVREAPSFWYLCCPECGFITCAALIHTPRQDISIFYPSLLQVGTWVAMHKMLASQ